MSFGEIATLTLHDVKNRLAELAGRAEQRGDRETMYAILDFPTPLGWGKH